MFMQRNAPVDKELIALLEKYKGYKMSPEEKEAQRKSYVVGELMLEDLFLTKEEAVKRYNRAKANSATD